MGLERCAALALLVAVALGGCADLLPKQQSEVKSGWRNFEEARAALERLSPGRSTVADLRAIGLDPDATPNVQLLTFSDIALRFPVNLPADQLDAGLRECLRAGKACIGYSIAIRDVKRDRVGDFWQDALGFKRVVDVSGWTFNALVLVVGERVVYTLYGGQPHLREQEVTRQPLGPVQGFGESLPLGNLVK